MDVGTIPQASLTATAQDPDIEGTNIVVTVEQPPKIFRTWDFQDLVVYAQHQLERLHQAKPTARQIGARAYVGGDTQAVLGVHTYVLNNTHCFRVFTLHESIATVATTTVSLSQMDLGLKLAHHTIESMKPATKLYSYPFSQKNNYDSE